MGTHCQMIVTDEQGITTKCERTMDGYNLVEAFNEWIDNDDFDAKIDPMLIGTGCLEIDDDCEDEAEFTLELNYMDRTFDVDWNICDKESFRRIQRLLDHGWDFMR